MGTYETTGGTAASPDGSMPYISPLVEEVLGVLENGGVGETYCHRIIKILEEHESDAACAAQERRDSGR